jgi:hypothetical protein
MLSAARIVRGGRVCGKEQKADQLLKPGRRSLETVRSIDDSPEGAVNLKTVITPKPSFTFSQRVER